MDASDAPSLLPVDLRRRRPTPAPPAVEIGGGRPWLRATAGSAIALAVFAVAVLVFLRFTASLRVATLVVALMATYMLAVRRLVEGRADRAG